MEEKRIFSRVAFVTDVKLTHKAKQFEAELINISLKGALLQPVKNVNIRIGDECDLSFTLHGSEIKLAFKMELVHKQEEKLGFKFISEDIESITHLRRLLGLNLGDAEQITHELPFLINT